MRWYGPGMDGACDSGDLAASILRGLRMLLLDHLADDFGPQPAYSLRE